MPGKVREFPMIINTYLVQKQGPSLWSQAKANETTFGPSPWMPARIITEHAL